MSLPEADAGHFNQPSGVVAAEDGSFYVTDGYQNTRVIHFAADGGVLHEWGAPGRGQSQFDLPHGVLLARDGRVYVADRENARVQTFDRAGVFVRARASPEMGRPFAIFETAPDSPWRGGWLISSRSMQAGGPDGLAWTRVNVVSAAGEVLGHFGEVTGTGNPALYGHGIAVGPDNAVYLAGSQGLLKFECR